MSSSLHPRQSLFNAEERLPLLPVCDHYAGVPSRMRKALQLQAERGPVFDVTLDNEDGAPVGGEIEQAHLIAELLASDDNRHGRVGVRLLPVGHRCFADVAAIVLRATRRPAYLMLPKLEGLACLQRAADAIDALGGADIPLHGLVEGHGALREVGALAAHRRIESLAFGLMDFVSAHRGAIPASAMRAAGQFDHPLVVRAKLEIAAACHGYGKVPSHSVVTEFQDTQALQAAAEMASRLLGYTRMWSIHPAQIEPILAAFSPTTAELDEAIEVIAAAQSAAWAPIRRQDTLHDRASYRYHWQVIERAWRSSGGLSMPLELRQAWFGDGAAP